MRYDVGDVRPLKRAELVLVARFETHEKRTVYDAFVESCLGEARNSNLRLLNFFFFVCAGIKVGSRVF